MTNVFISWSGERSRRIAEELHRWIPSTLQFTRPYFTPNDIEKGAKWATEISRKLSETDVGIICLTKENIDKPWILFEVGALSKDLEKSRVCSVLFGMDNADLSGPLTTFQTTAFEKADFKKLMQTINDAGGDRSLSRETFDSVFNMWWPRLDESIKAILASEGGQRDQEVRSDREILEEILSLSRINARRVANRESPLHTLPVGWVDRLLTSIESSIEIYEKDDDKRQFSVLSDQIELAKFLVGSSPRYEENFQSQLDNLKKRFDDIIPF